jgi:aldehyde:ferredoxin oxidoreductase
VHGYHGRYLLVDLTTGDARVESIPAAVCHAVLGGTGLATYLVYRHCPAGADPLGPANPLVFAASPLIGTGVTTASKVALAARSPQTGMIGDSLSSSYLALALKRTGFDAIVLTGAAPRASLLVVDGARVERRDATDLLGLDPAATATAVRGELGSDYRVAAIGAAGERLVRFAAVSNDGRLAGRTGAGAVMGSKRLKAVALRGSARTAVADAPGLAAAARDLAARSLGPGTAKYREVGTAANLAFFDRLGILPTRNFQSGRFEGAEAIAGETLLLDHAVVAPGGGADRHACAACTVGCEHRYHTTDGGAATEARLEYESLFALGSLCGVADPNTVLRASGRCDALGVDTISTGATIAWAMECRQRGLAMPDDCPAFGDADGLLATIEAIGARRGIGDLLAEGSRAAAAVVGQGSADWAMHVKGLELPGYDPRKLPTLALGLAISPRGACHNRSAAYEVDLSDRLDPAASRRARAAAAIESEDQAAVLDSLTLCKFLRHCFVDLPGEAANLYAMVTGQPTSGPDLLRAGARINTLKRLFNLRQGATRADDTLPPRLLAAIDLEPLLDAYYQARGWRADGTVPAETLDAIGLGADP